MQRAWIERFSLSQRFDNARAKIRNQMSILRIAAIDLAASQDVRSDIACNHFRTANLLPLCDAPSMIEMHMRVQNDFDVAHSESKLRHVPGNQRRRLR